MCSAKKSRLSPERPLYRHTRALSPAAMMSSLAAAVLLKTAAWMRKCASVLSSLRATGFPIPRIRDVVSQPRSACTNKMFEQTSSPSADFVFLMFHTLRIFDRCFGSGVQIVRVHLTMVKHQHKKVGIITNKNGLLSVLWDSAACSGLPCEQSGDQHHQQLEEQSILQISTCPGKD